MFESDQHDFDEEYEELSHPAPPFPVAKQPTIPEPALKQPASTATAQASAPTTTARPIVATASTARAAMEAPVAVAEPIIEEPEEEEEELEPVAEELPEFVDAAEQEPAPPPKKKTPNLLLMGGAAVLVIFAIFVVYTATKAKDNAPPPGDMGPGIVAASGLRGHLNTRWEGNTKSGRLVYQLSIQPMEDRWQAGFSNVVLKSPEPIYVNLRLLDATGFALCGKEIDLRFDPSKGYVPPVAAPLVGSDGKKLSAAERAAAVQAAQQSEMTQMQAAEAAREKGKDLFQNQMANDGEVSAVNVQGTLPCSPDQFRVANYWDFHTNFPTLDQQADLLNGGSPAERAKQAAAAHAARKPSSKPQQGFVIQGDDRVTEYDSVNGLLWARGRTFQIDRHTGATTATVWANNNTLIHYRCDQEANCALTAAGGTAVLHAWLR